MPHRTLNLAELAQYLHVARADVESLVLHREIPFERQGDRVIFRKREIDAWASQRIMGLPPKRLERFHQTSTTRVPVITGRTHSIVRELLQAGYVEPGLASRTRAAVLRDLVELGVRTDRVLDPEGLLVSLREREALCPTALPGGIALLHPRCHDPYMFEESFIVLARTLNPLPFGALDGSKTDLFFLICCQDDRIHLHVLARVCMMVQHTHILDHLRAAEDASSMLGAIAAAEDEVLKRAP